MDIGTSFITIAKTWPQLKIVVATDHLALRSEIENDVINIFAIDNPIVYLCTLYLGEVPHAVPMSQSDNDGYIADFNTNFASKTNTAITKRSEYGVVLADPGLRSGNKAQIISQNFCDKHTWYATSTRQLAESMIDSGDGYTWNLETPTDIVDVMHGRIQHERNLRSTYKTKVYVDDVEKYEKDPHDNAGDWVIDVDTGSITFDVSQSGKSVKIDYSKVINSKWYLKPSPGKKLRLISAELQFSTDTRMTDTFIFQPRGDVSKFIALAPYWNTNGGPYPAGTMLPLGNPSCYQTIFDLICEANLSHPIIPKIGDVSPTWRDTKSDILIFSWEYGEQATVDLSSGVGWAPNEIEISLEHDVECTGTYAVVTFYCLSEDI